LLLNIITNNVLAAEICGQELNSEKVKVKIQDSLEERTHNIGGASIYWS
jgi:hypothetical protein